MRKQGKERNGEDTTGEPRGHGNGERNKTIKKEKKWTVKETERNNSSKKQTNKEAKNQKN